MALSWKFAVFIALCMLVVYTSADAEVNALCEAAQSQTCDACIQAHPECTWCLKRRQENDSTKRCRSADQRREMNDCAKGGSDDTKGSVRYSENRTLSTVQEKSKNIGSSQQGLVQLKPQKIHLRLRKGESMKFNITFRKVSDYPVDLYYVMDLSNSMIDDLATLQNLGQNLAIDIRKSITEDIQLGFGTFVDKVMMPFASTVPEQLENPCLKTATPGVCAPPFGFRHQQKISGDLTAFKNAVNSTTISGNIDSPEGGLDALMQIAVCTEQIGWRKGATHLVVFTTDSSFHTALDGKLAAILEANDFGCYLERGANPYLPNDVVYSMSKRQDYPSVGQVKEVLVRNKIQPIFAVIEEMKEIYDGLKDIIPNSHVGTLDSDSGNIIEIIKEAYKKLTGSLTMTMTGAPKEVDLKYRVLCPKKDWTNVSLECSGILIGSEVVYEVEVTANDCPKKASNRTMSFSSSSLKESVEISIDFLCECECTRLPEVNSSQCSDSGSLVCGVCQCNDRHEGAKCQCVREEKDEALINKCKQFGLKDDVCSNHGQCECGVCTCDKDYFGQFCHCSIKGCPSDKSEEICGGPEKGVCKNCNNNRTCECINNYTAVQTSPKVCTCNDKYCTINSTICSGRGNCSCDKCVCNDIRLYGGAYCQDCIHPKCKGGAEQSCDGSRYVTCALCLNRAHSASSADSKKVEEACKKECGGKDKFKVVKVMPDCNRCEKENTCKGICAELIMDVSLPNQCATTMPQSDCEVIFKIVWFKKVNDFGVVVKEYNNQTDCPVPPNLLPIILPIIAGIFFLGLLALAIWKVYQTVRDKKEWENFENERRQSKWTKGQNPIFKKPLTNCKNPTYQGH